MTRSPLFAAVAALAASAFAVRALPAGDAAVSTPPNGVLKAAPGEWPQWRGPSRTGHSNETGLLASWPKDGPKLLWKVDAVGEGYASVSVAGGRLFTMGDFPEGCMVLALDPASGKRLWATKVGNTGSYGGYVGPKGTPTVDGELVYAAGQHGNLICLKAADGSVVWSRDFRKDFKGSSGGWGYAESPLIDGDRLICTPGAGDGCIAALNKLTGETIWKASVPTEVIVRAEGQMVGASDELKLVAKGGQVTAMLNGRSIDAAKVQINRPGTTDGAAYSSIIVAEFNGQKQYIQFCRGGVAGVSDQGRFLWRYDRCANGTANISTPVYADGFVFGASGYGTGGGLVKLSPGGPTGVQAAEVYFTNKMKNHHGGMILAGDHLYGFDEGVLTCIEFKTGKIVWQDRSVGKGSLVCADGRLIARSEGGRGTIALIEVNPKAYVEKGRFDQPERSRTNSWPHPVVAGGRLFIRDQEKLFCWDVKGR